LDLNGEEEWTGYDCSLRACPKNIGWIGDIQGSNDAHPWVECSNRGLCDRRTGECQCFVGYEGLACQRNSCPNDCNGKGYCLPEKYLAELAGRTYLHVWDALKSVGCVCDQGYRGPDCSLQECPSGPDPLGGYGNETGRDCSGRGLCNYETGICECFSGFYGSNCDKQTVTF
jgi:hypothetical protein